MTSDEAAIALSELKKLVENRRPGDRLSVEILSDLRVFFETLSLAEDRPEICIGNAETGKVAALDPRIWREEGIEWLDEGEIRVGKRKEVE